jgi:hypothetical protein
VADAEGKAVEFVEIERFKFYEDAKKAFAVVSTGETAFYANLILKKVRQRDRGNAALVAAPAPLQRGCRLCPRTANVTSGDSQSVGWKQLPTAVPQT